MVLIMLIAVKRLTLIVSETYTVPEIAWTYDTQLTSRALALTLDSLLFGLDCLRGPVHTSPSYTGPSSYKSLLLRFPAMMDCNLELWDK